MLYSGFRDATFAFGHEQRKPGEFKGTSPQTHNAYEMILLNNCEVAMRSQKKTRAIPYWKANFCNASFGLLCSWEMWYTQRKGVIG